MKVSDLLTIALKIDHGIRDRTTTDLVYAPLWKHPFLREAFITMLDSPKDAFDVNKGNFEIVCWWVCPEFLSVLATIENDPT